MNERSGHDDHTPEPSGGRPEGARPDQAWSQAYPQTRPFEAAPGTEYPAVPGPPVSGPPPGGDGPSGQPPSDRPQPAKPRRRVGLIVAVTSMVLVLLLVIAGVGSELYLRSTTKDCLQKSFSELTGSSATVSLSKKPMLLQYATKEIPYVQIDTSGDNGSAIELHGRADKISGTSDGSTVGTLAATGSVPFARIVELSKQAAQQSTDTTQTDSGQTGTSGLGGLFGGLTLTEVTGNAGAGTITINASVTLAGIIPIPVSTEIKPVVTGGKIEFQVVKASAFVFGVPANFAQTLVDGVSKSLFPPLFDQLAIDKLTVTSNGVDFAVTGSDVPLNKDTLGATEDTQNQSTCSVV